MRRINTVLQKEYKELLQILRERWFPGENVNNNTVRDSYLIGRAIQEVPDPDVLRPYLDRDSGRPLSEPKLVTLSADAEARLDNLKLSLPTAAAPIIRAAIDFSADADQKDKPSPLPPMTVGERQMLKEKVRIMRHQLEKLTESLEAINAILEEQET